MKLFNVINEAVTTVKIGNIDRNITGDELNLYKKIRKKGKLFKKDLTEFEQTTANMMVNKGLIVRRRSKDELTKGKIYFRTLGRVHDATKATKLKEVAPPSRESESWIKKNKKRFKDKYGKDYEKYLYGHAWKMYNKELTESVSNYWKEKYKVGNRVRCWNPEDGKTIIYKVIEYNPDSRIFSLEDQETGELKFMTLNALERIDSDHSPLSDEEIMDSNVFNATDTYYLNIFDKPKEFKCVGYYILKHGSKAVHIVYTNPDFGVKETGINLQDAYKMILDGRISTNGKNPEDLGDDNYEVDEE